MAPVARRARPRPPTPRRPRPSAGAAFARLVRLMSTLRAPGGCPWDRKQTHRSLRSYLLEETYEALDAIDRDDAGALAGELGDVLLQVVFHAAIAREARAFDVVDVIERLRAKLIRRHPHVFTPGGRRLTRSRRGAVKTPGHVVERWQQIKAAEQQADQAPQGLLAGVPRALPALLRAHKIGGRVAAVGFDWPSPGAVVDKIEEEVAELRAAVGEGRDRTAEELGDVLFTLANLARHLGVEPESALRQANDRFTERFTAVEGTLAAAGRSVHAATPEQLEVAWQAVKLAAATRESPTAGHSTSAPRPRRRRSRR